MTAEAQAARAPAAFLEIDPRGWVRYGGKLLHPIWLRERAPDAETLDPSTGQRLIEAADLPLDLQVVEASILDGTVHILFSDGYRAIYPRALLDRPETADDLGALRLWRGDLDSVPRRSAADAIADDAALAGVLNDLHTFGFVVLSGLEATEDGMQPLLDRIGPIRRTNWGGIADVKAIPSAYDLTMTARHLEQHADNPYRDPVPGFIFLHCIVNNADGGESIVADGFAAAQRLREEHPEDFRVLTTVRPRFRYIDATTHLEFEGPLIELDAKGNLRQVRFSNRTEMVEALPAETLDAYYRARAKFHALIKAPDMTLTFKLGPGDLLIMDNYRLLHGRRGYRLETGMRHMRQAYMDRDTVHSRRRVLSRKHP